MPRQEKMTAGDKNENQSPQEMSLPREVGVEVGLPEDGHEE